MLEIGQPLRLLMVQMSDRLFRVIQEEFVDRQQEITCYTGIIRGDNPEHIFCLQAEDGWGKSWLLMRFFLDSPKGKCFKALMDLGSIDAKDEEAFLERICERMGGAVSVEMAKVMNAPAQGASIRAGRDVKIAGDVTFGPKIIIANPGSKGDHLSVEVKDPYSRDRRVRDLTRAFQRGLSQLPPKSRAVLLLDRFDNATRVMRNWLVDILFTRLLNGEYPNLIIVVACKGPLDFFAPREWRATVLQAELGGIPETAIQEYWLQRRHLPQEKLKGLLRRAEKTSPLELSRYADQVEQGHRGLIGRL